MFNSLGFSKRGFDDILLVRPGVVIENAFLGALCARAGTLFVFSEELEDTGLALAVTPTASLFPVTKLFPAPLLSLFNAGTPSIFGVETLGTGNCEGVATGLGEKVLVYWEGFGRTWMNWDDLDILVNLNDTLRLLLLNSLRKKLKCLKGISLILQILWGKIGP